MSEKIKFIILFFLSLVSFERAFSSVESKADINLDKKTNAFVRKSRRFNVVDQIRASRAREDKVEPLLMEAAADFDTRLQSKSYLSLKAEIKRDLSQFQGIDQDLLDSALIMATFMKNYPVMNLLLRFKLSNISAQVEGVYKKRNPLHMAIINKDRFAMKLLLRWSKRKAKNSILKALMSKDDLGRIPFSYYQ